MQIPHQETKIKRNMKDLMTILWKALITSQTKDFGKVQIYSTLLTRNDETYNCSSENIIASVNSKLKYKVDMQSSTP